MDLSSNPPGCLKRGGTLLAALVLIYVVLKTLGIGPFLRPENVEIPSPGQAVLDARRMIQEKREDPELHEGWLARSDLPESLQLSNLAYVMVLDDHVNMVVTRNPDWEVGFRIWAADATRPHQDEPTEYPDIFFFDFTNDLPESPDNIR